MQTVRPNQQIVTPTLGLADRAKPFSDDEKTAKRAVQPRLGTTTHQRGAAEPQVVSLRNRRLFRRGSTDYFKDSPDRAAPDPTTSSWYFCPAKRSAVSSLEPEPVEISAASCEAFLSSWTILACVVAISLFPRAMRTSTFGPSPTQVTV